MGCLPVWDRPPIVHQMNKPVYFNGKTVGEIISGERKAFITKRNRSHYFISYGGFGISIEVFQRLISEKVNDVIIDYNGIKTKKRLRSGLTDWITKGNLNVDEVWGNQLVLAESDMEEI